MDYKEIAPTLQTADVFLFRGDAFVSEAIELITDSRFSHAGMVYRAPDGSLYLWQSFEPEGGVVLDPLEAFLDKYRSTDDGAFVVRRLVVERTPTMLQGLHEFMGEVKGRPFPGITEGLEHWLEGLLDIDTGNSDFFCSELVAASFERMDLFPTDPPANFYTPGDFSADYDKLPLQKGASFGPEIPVTFSASPLPAAARS